MRGLRTDRPPTREQLLVLADRAERGPLTASEAARLRAGISAVYASQRIVGDRTRLASRARREAADRIAAVTRLTAAARRRGVRSIPVRDLEMAIGAAVRPSDGSGAREGRSVARSV
ncbi:hypothetical protein ADK92_05550 [Streptomyces sp. XY533]|nr:hypothetical protein ADK92_05550 [Streptomyces sp. XY533]